MNLPITHLPSQVLRREVEDLSFPLKKPVLRLIRDMLDTVKKANGVGLAAPQVGKSLNLAIIYLEELEVPPFVIINPTIVTRSKETATMDEGCLSMPGVFGAITRPKKITMEAYDMEGKKFTITDDTFLARVLQHEIDHLNGALIKDKMGPISQGEHLLKRYEEKPKP